MSSTVYPEPQNASYCSRVYPSGIADHSRPTDCATSSTTRATPE